MDEMIHNCEIKQTIPNDGGSNDSVVVLAEKKLIEDMSHYSEENHSNYKESDITYLQKTEMNEMVHMCQIKLSVDNDDDDGGDNISNSMLTDRPTLVDEAPLYYAHDNRSICEESKFTNVQETEMNEMVHMCQIKLSVDNDDDDGGDNISNSMLTDRPTLVDEAPLYYAHDNRSICEESKFTNVQETEMNEMVHMCQIKLSVDNDDDDGGDNISNSMLTDRPTLVDEAPLYYAHDNRSICEESKFTNVQETGMDEMVRICQTKLSIENEFGGDDISNTMLTDTLVDQVPSYYSQEEKKSSCKDSRFIDNHETGNDKLSSTHDASLEDEISVKNFQNVRDVDMENGINVEHILSCLKRLQCPFVWKPDKEVEIHPRGEVPMNLTQHLTEKERGFICMETDLFREVTIYLVLAYHKYITMLPKEGLLDIYHCYEILLKAEKEMFKVVNEDTKKIETNISDVSTSVTQSVEEDLNSPQGESLLCNSGNSSQDNENDCNDLPKTESNQKFSVTPSSDNSRCIKQRKTDLEFLVKNEAKDTDLFAKLFDTKTHCEWTNANSVQKTIFENWKTENSNVTNESYCSSTKLTEDKAESHLEIQMNNQTKTEKEKEKELQKLYALQCVTAASLAHFAFSYGCGQDVLKIMEYIEKLSKSLNSVGEAVILALRGAVLCEYGYVGNKLALPLFKEALRLDPDNWEWNLYCAKVIGRLRRNEKTCNTEPSEEEIQMLKKAVELNPTNASCLVHLANAYRTVAGAHYRQRLVAQAGSACDDPLLNSRLQRNWRSSRSSWRQDELWKQMPITTKGNKEYLSMAKELYLEALKYGRNCPYTNARCAKGLWSMPNPYKDKKIAQETILHALCLAPDDSLVNHHAGMFYEYCHDYDKALSCYEIATQNGKFNYPAEMNYINLRLKIAAPGSYSPIFRLHGLLHKYNGVNHMVQTLCLRGYYHYEIEKILLLAIQNFAMAIELKPTSPILTDFYPGQMLKNYPESVNIYDLLERILQDFETHLEHSVNKDIVKYATDILKIGIKVRNESCASSAES